MKLSKLNRKHLTHKARKVLILVGVFLILGIIAAVGIFPQKNNRGTELDTDITPQTAGWREVHNADIIINNFDTNFSNDWDDYSSAYEWCYMENGAWIIENVSLNGFNITISSNRSFIIRNSLIQNVEEKNAIEITDSGEFTIVNNTINNTKGIAVKLSNCNDFNISNNSIYNTSQYYSGSIPFGGKAIDLLNCINGTFDNNTVNSGLFGLSIAENNIDVSIINNSIGNNIYSGISIKAAQNITILNNELFGKNTLDILDRNGVIYNYTIVNGSNKVDGKPLIYYQDVSGLQSEDFSNAGQVILLNCSNTVMDKLDVPIHCYFCNDTTISNNTIDSFNFAINFQKCNETKLLNNDILNNAYGVYLINNNRSKIEGNSILFNYVSMQLLGFQDSELINNTVANSSASAIVIRDSSFEIPSSPMKSRNLTISFNTIRNNSCEGLMLEVNNSIISSNTFDNNPYGIGIAEGSSNIFFNNSFTNNDYSATDNCEVGANDWNNTETGNYWDDYTGVDNDKDGFGDTPYNIGGGAGSQDHLPIYIDTTPPDVFVNTPEDIIYNTDTIKINATVLGPETDTVIARINGETDISLINIEANYWYNDTFTFPDGNNNVQILANDTHGNMNNSEIATFTVDTTAPEWDSPPQDQISEECAPFIYDVNATDFTTNVDIYLLNETSPFNIYAMNGTIYNNTDLTSGIYWLDIIVNDTQGNENISVISITIVQSEAPQWNPVPTPQKLGYNESFFYVVNATDVSELDSFSINESSPFIIDVNTGVITNNSVLTVGIYWLELKVNDTCGLFNETQLKINVTDPIAPHTSIDISFVDENKIYQDTAISLIGDDGMGSGIQSVWYRIDEGSWQEYTTSFEIDIQTYGTGEHTIEYYAIDNYRNNGTVESTTVNLIKRSSSPESPLPFIIIIGASVGGGIGAGVVGAIVMRRRKTSKSPVKTDKKTGPENEKDNYSYESYDDNSS